LAKEGRLNRISPHFGAARMLNRPLADEVSSAGVFGFWSDRARCLIRCQIA
jgi:hypothetical protein